jgi:SynChlorMet cassette radical SAM/SPASM protein ScmF
MDSPSVYEAAGAPAVVDEPVTPQLRMIYFYLTEGCNLACRHCWIAPRFQRSLTEGGHLALDTMKSIVAEARELGLNDIKLTGGEPLLHPQILPILEWIRDEKLVLTVETNGVLCTPEIARAIAACGEPFVSISLDGPDAATHEWMRGVPGCFEGAMQGARHLVEAGLRPQFIMSIARRNRDGAEALVRLAEEHGAGSVKFNIVAPVERGQGLMAQGELLTIEETLEFSKWALGPLKESSKISIRINIPPAFQALGNLFGPSGGPGRCGIFTIMGVLWDGSYALCGIGQSVPELVFGHAERDRLRDVWRNTPVLQQLREGLPSRLEGVCGQCLLKSLCLGQCIAHNYYFERNIWAAHAVCKAAYEHGLFPENRLAQTPV